MDPSFRWDDVPKEDEVPKGDEAPNGNKVPSFQRKPGPSDWIPVMRANEKHWVPACAGTHLAFAS